MDVSKFYHKTPCQHCTALLGSVCCTLFLWEKVRPQPSDVRGGGSVLGKPSLSGRVTRSPPAPPGANATTQTASISLFESSTQGLYVLHLLFSLNYYVWIWQLLHSLAVWKSCQHLLYINHKVGVASCQVAELWRLLLPRKHSIKPNKENICQFGRRRKSTADQVVWVESDCNSFVWFCRTVVARRCRSRSPQLN